MSETKPVAEWDEETSQHFIDYGAYFVPEREAQIDTIVQRHPAPDGPAISSRSAAARACWPRRWPRRFPGATSTRYDGSDTMLASTAAKLEAAGNPYTTASWRSPKPAGAASTSRSMPSSPRSPSTICTGRARRSSSRTSPRRWRPAAPSSSATLSRPRRRGPEAVGAPLGRRRAPARPGARRQRQDADLLPRRRLELLQRARRRPGRHALAARRPVGWMAEAGLEQVDVHWLKAGHAIFSARKPGA